MKPMHIIFKILTLAISLFSFATIATANDSGAKLVGGGLVLQKLENIAMVSENLYISEDKIIVDYVFENTSNHDITTIVAFPLPPHPVEPYSDTGAGVTAAPDAIADNFVNFKTFVDGKRVKTQYKKEQKIGFAEVEDQEIFQITYYWQQNFPKGKKIKIRHEYRPMTGSGIPRTPNEFEEMVTNEYCPDNGFRAALAKMRKQNEWAGWRDIGYI